MGLLKHVILPLLILLDVKVVYDCLVTEDISGIQPLWAPDRDVTTEPLSPLERHFIHLLGGACLCLAVNMGAAVVVENAHYRGMALLLHTLFFAIDGVSYVLCGVEMAPPVFVIVGLGVVSLAIHSQEPGIFTKDKTKAKTK